jgi:hypothetical protein
MIINYRIQQAKSPDGAEDLIHQKRLILYGHIFPAEIPIHFFPDLILQHIILYFRQIDVFQYLFSNILLCFAHDFL